MATVKLGISKASYPRYLQQFLETKALSSEAEARLKKQRDALMAFVERHGIEDEKGHVRLEADGVGIAKRERRMSEVFDEEFTEEWLRKHKLYDACTRTETVIDVDALYAKLYDGTIPEKVREQMFPTKTSYAFKVEAVVGE